MKRTQGTETSQYLEEEKSSRDARSSGERKGQSPNRGPRGLGVVGPTDAGSEGSGSPLERGAADGDSPVRDADGLPVVEFLSSARLEESGVKLGGPPSKAKDSRVTDSGRVP
jgi:hypothetical protein